MHRVGSEEGVRGQANFPFAGILLQVGFWLMDREICTSISGYKGSPRELMLTLAYLTGQGWKALVLGHGEGGGLEEGRRPPGLSSPIRLANSALPSRWCRRRCAAARRLWGSGSRSSHLVGVTLSLPGLGTGTRSTAQSVVSRRHIEARTGAGRTAGMCLFQRCLEVS